MKRKNLDITVLAVLYIKSKLLLNGFGDLTIKDMLRQIGLDVDKPFKISLENEYWLKYECGGKTISFNFSNDTLKDDESKILALDIINEGIWERFGFFKPKIGRTRLSKINQEKRVPLIIKNNNIIGDFTDEEEYDERVYIEETINKGLTSPFEIVLKIDLSLPDTSSYENDTYVECIQFRVFNWSDYVYYNFDSKSYKKLLDFIKQLNHRKGLNIIDIYEEICSIYGLQVDNIKEKYHLNLYVSMKDAKCNLSRGYNLEEENGTIEVREDGLVSIYTRKTERGLSLIRRKGKNARNEV